jgi:glycosyltransferase involved in cell wall biosynthesis
VAFHEGVLGGATLSVLRIVPLLESLGWRFLFWVPKPSELFNELESAGHAVYGAPRHVSFSLRALRLPPGPRQRLTRMPGYFDSFRRALRDLAPDIVHANSIATLPEASVARLSGRPVVVHVHEMVPWSRKGRVAAVVARGVSSELVAVSQACGERLAGSGSRPRIVFESAPIPPSALRRPPASGRSVVGTVGVVSRRKGSDTFVEAARLVKAETREVEFEMIGPITDPLDADWAAQVLEDAARIGISHTPRADVQAALGSWDIFALPSRRDPCPISLLEAMAAGLPVVGTDVDGIPEQIAETGRLVADQDAEALAREILDLHRSPADRAELGDAARERAIATFSPEAQAAGLDRIYRSAARPAGSA